MSPNLGVFLAETPRYLFSLNYNITVAVRWIHLVTFFFLQYMDKLPDSLNLRFRFYLNILPKFEECMMYSLIVGGVMFLFFSLYKFIKIMNSKLNCDYPWLEDELVYNIDRKLSSYIPDRKFSAKELEAHLESLIVPINIVNENIITRDN